MSKIRADKFVNNAADGAPQLTYGIEIPVGYGLTGAGGVNITGVATAAKFVGSGSGLSGIDATTLKDSGGSIKVQGNTSGVVVTGVSTFSSNVSIGGTITYEDVTSIDSVGIITARSGIKIGAGQSVSAVSGIVTYYGDGSKLSGVESGVVNFVASGDIGNGQTVVIKTDGTVGIVTLTTSNTPSVSSEIVYATAETTWVSATYDSTNQKVVIAYKDNANSERGTAIVGTVSGNTISFGSEVVFNSTGNTQYISAIYDSTNQKVVIVYQDIGDSYYGKAIVGTVSGTSISFGSEVTFNSANTGYIAATFVGSGKVVVVYQDSSNGKVKVGTVSGTSISFGSEVTFNSGSVPGTSTIYDSTNNKVVIAYRDGGNSSYGTAIVGTVSGTSISFGSEVVFNTANTVYNSCTYDSTNSKVVVVYTDGGNSNYLTSRVGTVSGTSISFGSAVVFNSAGTNYFSATFDSNSGKVVIGWNNNGNSDHGTAIVGTVSGTSISFGSALVFNSGASSYVSSTYDSTNKKVVIAYTDVGNSNYGTSVVFSATSQVTNLTSENYIGIAAEAIANGATGRINVLTGTNTGQTGLTTAQKYFVQPNGTLGTSAGSPSVVAGTAISGTKIVVR